MILKKITGIILSQRPRGEFDRMIEVFSYEYGRMLVLAKGVRYIKSRRSFHLDLLNLVNMELEQ
ncbi:MAG: recombination protein O N-terminal domain-containing protein, partial [Patescibacteria group bacterium]